MLMDLKRKPSSSWNPQSGTMLERAHQAFGDMLRAFELGGAALAEIEPLQKLLYGAPMRAEVPTRRKRERVRRMRAWQDRKSREMYQYHFPP